MRRIFIYEVTDASRLQEKPFGLEHKRLQEPESPVAHANVELTEPLADNSRRTTVSGFVWLVNFRQLQSHVLFSPRLLAAELHADAVCFRGKNSAKIR